MNCFCLPLSISKQLSVSEIAANRYRQTEREQHSKKDLWKTNKEWENIN